MKRTISGMQAYSKMIGAERPAKTDTYTPIAHSNVINRVRSEITNAGFIITGEEYRCSNDAQVAIGTFRMNYKADPDIELSANFLNSYNKQFAFRFNLGGLVKVCNNGMMLNNNKFGAYKRVHKGAADLLAEGKIGEFIKDSETYWENLVEHKDKMKDILLTSTNQHDLLGELFFKRKILNTMQLNQIRNELEKPSFEYKVDSDSAWALYNHVTLSLKDSHPSTWMDDQTVVHEVFANMLGLEHSFDEEIEDTSDIDVYEPIYLPEDLEEEKIEEVEIL